MRNGLLACGAVAVVSSCAWAGTVSFNGPTVILPGPPILQYAVTVASSDLFGFDTVSMTIGSRDGLGLSFAYDPTFFAQTTPLTTAPGPVGIYGAMVPGATDVGFTAFRGPGPLWTSPVLVGTLTIDTSSLDSGDFAPIGIDTAFEVANLGSVISLVANGSNQDPLSGEIPSPFPEPATLGLLALGGMAMALRRRNV